MNECRYICVYIKRKILKIRNNVYLSKKIKLAVNLIVREWSKRMYKKCNNYLATKVVCELNKGKVKRSIWL